MSRLSKNTDFEDITDEVEYFPEEKPIKVTAVPMKDNDNLSESAVIEMLIKSQTIPHAL